MRVSPSLNAIHRAVDDADTRAARLARSGATAETATDDLVGIREDRHQVALNAQVIRAQDELLGPLLDIRA